MLDLAAIVQLLSLTSLSAELLSLTSVMAQLLSLTVKKPQHAVILTAPQSLANDKIRVVLGSLGVLQVMSGVRKIGRTILQLKLHAPSRNNMHFCNRRNR